ncbi:MAG TPA: hypothetical protein PLN33_14895 [Hyphomonadaceae bacterium]|nr:hypothetical protein [Hyphomonadaceae bacterium]HPN04416.1 hypothetical protein [Hyphomonadaceae bacterium]
MGGAIRVFIFWDAEIDGPFRRRLERALGELQVDFDDASQVDFDPEAARPLKLSIVSPRGEPVAHADVVLLGGPGEFHATSSAMRLEANDIVGRTRRWIAFAEKLGQRLGRPALAQFAADTTTEEQRTLSLTYPADPLSRDFAPDHSPDVLMEKAAAAVTRAEAAERAIAIAQLNEATAIRGRRTAEAVVAVERARVAELEKEIDQLSALSETTTYALGSVPADTRPVVSEARAQAWQGRLAAARAEEMARAHPEALVWKNGASYSGETVNRQPEGHGVIVFSAGGREVARYAGGFVEGRRVGLGIAMSDGGLIWTGQWQDDEACGYGLLETPDGRRFEGQVAHDESGAPKRIRGWEWKTAPVRSKKTHSVKTLALPAPETAT